MTGCKLTRNFSRTVTQIALSPTTSTIAIYGNWTSLPSPSREEGAVNEPCLLNLLFVSVNRLDNSKLAEGKTSSREVVKLVQHDSLIERVFFFGRRVVVGRHPRISETTVSLPSLAKLYKDGRGESCCPGNKAGLKLILRTSGLNRVQRHFGKRIISVRKE